MGKDEHPEMLGLTADRASELLVVGCDEEFVPSRFFGDLG
jgi:hypothetical protein